MRRSSGSTSSSRAASAPSTRDRSRIRSRPRFASASSAAGWSATSARLRSARTRSSPASTSTHEPLNRWPTGSAGRRVDRVDELLAHELDVVIVAVPHDRLAEHACAALERIGARPRREACGHRDCRRRPDRARGRGGRPEGEGRLQPSLSSRNRSGDRRGEVGKVRSRPPHARPVRTRGSRRLRERVARASSRLGGRRVGRPGNAPSST